MPNFETNPSQDFSPTATPKAARSGGFFPFFGGTFCGFVIAAGFFFLFFNR